MKKSFTLHVKIFNASGSSSFRQFSIFTTNYNWCRQDQKVAWFSYQSHLTSAPAQQVKRKDPNWIRTKDQPILTITSLPSSLTFQLTSPSSMNSRNEVLSISTWLPVRSKTWIMKWKKLDLRRLEGGCFVNSILPMPHLKKMLEIWTRDQEWF